MARRGIRNGVAILAVVAINSLIGFVQEYRAGRAIETLSQMVPENVTVLRDGLQNTVPAADLVVALAVGALILPFMLLEKRVIRAPGTQCSLHAIR